MRYKIGDVLRSIVTAEEGVFLGGDRIWTSGRNRQMQGPYEVIGHNPHISALMEVIDLIREDFMLTTSFFANVFDMMETVSLDGFGKLDYASKAKIANLLIDDNDKYQQVRKLLKLDGLSQMEEACQIQKT